MSCALLALMYTRLRNLWRPQNFHLHHRLHSRDAYFEGWYFKIVDGQRHPFAIIPGVFMGEDAHAFVQVLDGTDGKAWYHRFPIATFEASRHDFDVRIANNRFHAGGLSLDLNDESAAGSPRIRGELRFGRLTRWPVRWLSPGVMGPLGLWPFLQCYHGILSVDHTLHGALTFDEVSHSFEGGRGYLEKDWGRGFPEGYVWMQSNHFDEPGTSLTASVAKVPILGAALRGFLAGFLHQGTLHRFTAYNGARLAHCSVSDTHVHLRFEDRQHVLEVEAKKAQGAVLKAPYERQMLERVAETMRSEVSVCFSERKRGVVYEGVGTHGGLEAQGNLHAVTGDGRTLLSSLAPALSTLGV